MWTSIPCLNFNTKSFTQLADFKRFVKHVLSQRDDTTTSRWLLNQVIEFATSHGVEEIRINFGGKCSDNPPTELPSYLFASQSLERISFKSCHTTNLPTSVVGSKSQHNVPLQPCPPNALYTYPVIYGLKLQVGENGNERTKTRRRGVQYLLSYAGQVSLTGCY